MRFWPIAQKLVVLVHAWNTLGAKKNTSSVIIKVRPQAIYSGAARYAEVHYSEHTNFVYLQRFVNPNIFCSVIPKVRSSEN